MSNAAPAPAPVMKPWIEAMHAYVPGKAKADGAPVVAKLSSNENPWGPSPKAVAAMQAVLAEGHRYPDPASTQLRAALGAKYGVDPAHIICGTGSDEILHMIASAFAGPGDEIIHVRHGFAVYEGATRRVGATPVVVPDVDYTGDVDAILAAITPATRVIYVANPNNPTGTLLPAADIRRLIAGVPANVVLVLDCAYAEFVDGEYEDGLALAQTLPNLIVTRTFSKIHGLAAQRIGWAVAALPLIAAMDRVRGPFNVTSTGQAGAVASLADDAHIAMVRAETIRLRGWLAGEIAALGNAGLRAIPSACNFILVEFPEDGPVTAAACNQYLLDHGIICRYLAVQNMPRALRISIGTETETRTVAAALRDYVEGATGAPA
ncbi:histidinol-phosphate transaminase [Sandarakinorhabdus cyanobacteriorum]|uniref:Histidinol-phosphate aminotransferase n=2 Tax=Sandarakinorhabdus cyanobacteriorum TaxID=1981098 RepID=A0A255YPC5_9SPHN|nr:histidinol-phosphate transaminase [Sandarakinorhabdus cyanobacteriorum]